MKIEFDSWKPRQILFLRFWKQISSAKYYRHEQFDQFQMVIRWCSVKKKTLFKRSLQSANLLQIVTSTEVLSVNFAKKC